MHTYVSLPSNLLFIIGSLYLRRNKTKQDVTINASVTHNVKNMYYSLFVIARPQEAKFE